MTNHIRMNTKTRKTYRPPEQPMQPTQAALAKPLSQTHAALEPEAAYLWAKHQTGEDGPSIHDSALLLDDVLRNLP